MTKPVTTQNTTSIESQADDTEVVSDESSDLGIEFFDGFMAEDSHESDVLSELPLENAGGDEAASATPAGGDAAAPASPSGTPDPAAPAAEVAKVTPETPAATPPAETPPVVPAAAAKPEGEADPAQQAQAQQQPPTQTAGNEVPGDMLSNVRAEVDKNRQVYTNLLAEKVYGMSDDDAKALFETPEKVLPALAAKVHLEVVQNVLGTLAQILPSQIAAVQQVQTQQKALLDDFWTSHPTLDPKADHAAVMQLAQLFRVQNPNASFDEFKRVVGSQAMVMLNKLPAASGTPARVVTPPGAPRTPAHKPAGQGTSPLAPTGQASPNDFWGAFSEQLNE